MRSILSKCPSWCLIVLLTVFVVSCQAPKESKTSVPGAEPTPASPVDVWLVPCSGFPRSNATELATRLSNELKLNVMVSPKEMVVEPEMFAGTSQLIATLALPALRKTVAGQAGTTAKTVVIGLAVHDMNDPQTGWNYTLAIHAPDKHSIVSKARMENAFLKLPVDPEITQQRLYKMVKKAIGRQYFGKGPSSDIRSVMFTPMGIEELDKMGTAW